MSNVANYLLLTEFQLSQSIAIFTLNSPQLTLIAKFFSGVGLSLPLWAIVLTAVSAYEVHIHKNKNAFREKLLKIMWSAAIAIILTLTINELFIKNLVARPRPYTLQLQVASYTPHVKPDRHTSVSQVSRHCPADYGFASSHATLAFAIAAILIYFDHNRKRHIFYGLVASLISISRILLYCHYPTDVLAGALLGVLIANIAIKVYLKLALDHTRQA